MRFLLLFLFHLFLEVCSFKAFSIFIRKLDDFAFAIAFVAYAETVNLDDFEFWHAASLSLRYACNLAYGLRTLDSGHNSLVHLEEVVHVPQLHIKCLQVLGRT